MAGLSAGWEKSDAVIMDQLGPVGVATIERLGIAEDQQHLDIAAGMGEPGMPELIMLKMVTSPVLSRKRLSLSEGPTSPSPDDP